MIYTGVHAEVYVPITDKRFATSVSEIYATKGEPTEVPDELAEKLLEQADAWKKAPEENSKK